MSAQAEQKSSWPELVGKSADEAKAVIEAEFPGVKVQVVGVNQPVTMDYRFDRVRIAVDANNVVAVPPNIG